MTDSSSFDPARFVNATRARSTAAAMSRRSLLRGLSAGGLTVAGAAALSACGVKGHSTGAAGGAKIGLAGKDLSDQDKTLLWANWPAYIDVDDKNPNVHPTLDAFEKQSGVKVTYKEVINDNNDWYTHIDPSLSKGVFIGYDLMVVSDYMLPKYRANNYIQELDLANIPNHKNILPDVMKAPEDPGRRFSTPWAYGYTTIAYNKNLVHEPITSIAEVFTRPDLHGKVSLFSEMEDTMALALLATGHDPSNFTGAQFNQALDYVRKAKDAGQFRAFTGNDYLSDFQQGNTAVTMAYSGDVAQLGKPELTTVDLPKEGMLSWSDNMIIPNYARHKKNAELLMNYYLEPMVAAVLDDYIDYIPVVTGAVAELKKLDHTAASTPLIVPTAQMRAKARGFMAVSLAQLDDYTSRFQQVTGQ
ncbi:spermidine/putrescine ABC transporter substrate-binding protein [Streptomyces sp. SL13]|uniref:Spermidine/putrescine ABC transporter substrate-binding protein n=1 Tax=Streptantibioticus silvisoli TaxID=2705255 RepID=A0AA90H3V1_9ACTN|nr:spermidine/putrescine ABC transporter substrate-binding protein [Streptantibioticus silvisoli]MDI5965293.1 spermidine/putrescine ABC transporter substrate-binding protein [Streptantibioticus silvisoli]MDI5972924.1 spermidine/putrescine ABC transporter substrate-binding protein [Streptantibioticus silvisoli]